MCAQTNWVNWNLRWPPLRVLTKKTKPGASSFVSLTFALAEEEGAAHTNNIKGEADEAMVGSQRKEDPIDHDNVLEVVDDAFAVEEVHGYRQPVPVQALGGLDVPGATSSARDGDDFLERDDLDGGDDDDDVDVAHEEGGEEAANHDQGP